MNVLFTFDQFFPFLFVFVDFQPVEIFNQALPNSGIIAAMSTTGYAYALMLSP